MIDLKKSKRFVKLNFPQNQALPNQKERKQKKHQENLLFFLGKCIQIVLLPPEKWQSGRLRRS
ncbi:MAG: hypothetical protein RLZZ543_1240 [Bacteroidota bacterium]